jgi:hypothetical protein
MKCVKCNTPMILGQAFNPHGLNAPATRYFCYIPPAKITIENLDTRLLEMSKMWAIRLPNRNQKLKVKNE